MPGQLPSYLIRGDQIVNVYDKTPIFVRLSACKEHCREVLLGERFTRFFQWYHAISSDDLAEEDRRNCIHSRPHSPPVVAQTSS